LILKKIEIHSFLKSAEVEEKKGDRKTHFAEKE